VTLKTAKTGAPVARPAEDVFRQFARNLAGTLARKPAAPRPRTPGTAKK